jgi:hypothetical protein
MTHHVSSKGFFATLFDFSFTSFVTLKFLKVIYAIAVVVIGLGALIWMFIIGSAGGIFVLIALVAGPLAALIYLISVRITFEVIAVLFRIGENTAVLAGQSSAPPSPPPATWQPSTPPQQ